MASNNGTAEKAREMMRQRKAAFKLTCPMCGEKDAEIVLDLRDLCACTCNACGDSVAVSTAVRLLTDQLAEWVRLQTWIDMAAVLADPSTESE